MLTNIAVSLYHDNGTVIDKLKVQSLVTMEIAMLLKTVQADYYGNSNVVGRKQCRLVTMEIALLLTNSAVIDYHGNSILVTNSAVTGYHGNSIVSSKQCSHWLPWK